MYRDPLEQRPRYCQACPRPLLPHWTMETSRCVQYYGQILVQCEQNACPKSYKTEVLLAVDVY